MQKSLKKIVLSIFLVTLFLFSPLILLTYAQSVSGCATIKVGTPPGNELLPPGCNVNNGKWPFPSKDPSQFFRIDQGWDLQFNQQTPVFAVAPGTVNKNHGADPCGFGAEYPIVVLDTPITVNGHTYTQMYYGHIKTRPEVIGQHINAGDTIGDTYPDPLTGGCHPAWPVGWLEMGFWGPSGPIAGSAPYPTEAGTDMKQWLNGLSN